MGLDFRVYGLLSKSSGEGAWVFVGSDRVLERFGV